MDVHLVVLKIMVFVLKKYIFGQYLPNLVVNELRLNTQLDLSALGVRLGQTFGMRILLLGMIHLDI